MRLGGEPTVDYISPVGGGYFCALQGREDLSDWYNRGLLEAGSGAPLTGGAAA